MSLVDPVRVVTYWSRPFTELDLVDLHAFFTATVLDAAPEVSAPVFQSTRLGLILSVPLSDESQVDVNVVVTVADEGGLSTPTSSGSAPRERRCGMRPKLCVGSVPRSATRSARRSISTWTISRPTVTRREVSDHGSALRTAQRVRAAAVHQPPDVVPRLRRRPARGDSSDHAA